MRLPRVSMVHVYDDDDEQNDVNDGESLNVNERTKLLWVLWLYDLFMACVASNGRAFLCPVSRMCRLFGCSARSTECFADTHRSMNGVAFNIIVYGCAIKTINKFGHCRIAAHRRHNELERRTGCGGLIVNECECVAI